MFRKFLVHFGFGLWLISGLANAQELGEFKAVLQRGDYKKMRITVNVNSLDAPDWTIFELADKFDEQSGISMLTKFLDICIFAPNDPTKICGETPLKVTYTNNNGMDTTPPSQLTLDYSATFVAGSTQFTRTDTTAVPIYKLTSQIELQAGSTPFALGTTVAVRLYTGRSTTGNNFKEIESKAATLAVAVQSAPGGFELNSSKGTLTGLWTADEVVDLADGNKGEADSVLAFAVPSTDFSQRLLPLQAYNKDDPAKENKLAKSCSVEADLANKTCTLDCVDMLADVRYYMKKADIEAAGYPVYESGSNNSIGINGLAKGSTYAFIIQYQPDGLTRSCLIGSPSDAGTLTELGGGPEPALKDPRCFIATAAYGSPLDPHLKSLRWFRDHVLLVTHIGRDLVHTYYRLSPPIADFIAEHPALRATVRAGLWLPVILIESWRERPSLLLILLTISSSLALLYLRRRSWPTAV